MTRENSKSQSRNDVQNVSDRKDRVGWAQIAIFLAVMLSIFCFTQFASWRDIAFGTYAYKDANFLVKGVPVIKSGRARSQVAVGEVEGRSLRFTIGRDTWKEMKTDG